MHRRKPLNEGHLYTHLSFGYSQDQRQDSAIRSLLSNWRITVQVA